MPTYSSPFGVQQAYSNWNRPIPTQQAMPYTGLEPMPNQPWGSTGGGMNPIPNQPWNTGGTLPASPNLPWGGMGPGSMTPLPEQPWGGGVVGVPASGGNTPPAISPFPSINYGQWQTPVTGFSPYVPSALQSDPGNWRNRLSDNGQETYNEAMRQLRIDQMRPPTEGTQEDYQNWQIQMQERANQIERDYEIAQKEYGQAWNEYVGAKAYNLIPYLGDQDRAYIENMVGAVVPGTQPVESTASDGTRADDRNLQLKDRWAAVRQGLEWGNQLFGNQTDPDPRTQDRFEQSQEFLSKVADVGEQYGLRDTAHDFRRWQLGERANAYNSLKSAYAPVLDERVVALADTLFNPSQAGSAPSPMAQQLGGRYTRPNAGGNTGRQSANWAYRNSSLM